MSQCSNNNSQKIIRYQSINGRQVPLVHIDLRDTICEKRLVKTEQKVHSVLNYKMDLMEQKIESCLCNLSAILQAYDVNIHKVKLLAKECYEQILNLSSLKSIDLNSSKIENLLKAYQSLEQIKKEWEEMITFYTKATQINEFTLTSVNQIKIDLDYITQTLPPPMYLDFWLTSIFNKIFFYQQKLLTQYCEEYITHFDKTKRSPGQESFFLHSLLICLWKYSTDACQQHTTDHPCKLMEPSIFPETHTLFLIPDSLLLSSLNETISNVSHFLTNMIEDKKGTDLIFSLSSILQKLTSHFPLKQMKWLWAFLSQHTKRNINVLELFLFHNNIISQAIIEFADFGYNTNYILKGKLQTYNGYIFIVEKLKPSSACQLL